MGGVCVMESGGQVAALPVFIPAKGTSSFAAETGGVETSVAGVYPSQGHQ